MQIKCKLNSGGTAKKQECVFLKSLDRFLLVKLISLSNYLVPY